MFKFRSKSKGVSRKRGSGKWLSYITLIGVFVYIVLMLSTGRSAPAAVFSCSSGDVSCLIDAIHTANTNGQSNTINLSAGGAYTLTNADNDTDGSNGLPDITSQITINGNGATIERNSSLTCNDNSITEEGEFRIFHVGSRGNLTLNDVTVNKGCADGDTPEGGGGIFNSGALDVINSTFSGNNANFGGGGIENFGTLAVTNSTFSGNFVANGSGGGAGIWNGNNGALNVTNSTFSGNRAFDSGGGGIVNGGTLSVINSTFSGNVGEAGGGVLNVGTLTITNSTFFDNQAFLGGGGIWNGNDGTLNVTSSTFSDNSIVQGGDNTEGGGIDNDGTATLRNTIVANSSLGVDCFNNGGTLTDEGYNIDDDGTCGLSAANNSLPSTDPQLDPPGLKHNGGPTQTLALQSTSPAIDAIPIAKCTDEDNNPLTTDQRGVSRPQGAGCDIGAFEVEVPTADLSVTKSGSPNTVTPLSSKLTYTITVTDSGPSDATGVTLTDNLPSGVIFVSATPSQGGCSGKSTITCNLGNISNGKTATVKIIVTPILSTLTLAPKTITNTATVTGKEFDPNTANNRATAVTTAKLL